jgi:hypothetical protein
MANVTYLLGAGASCEALPTYNNFQKRFIRFSELIKNDYYFVELDDDYKFNREILIKILDAILSEFRFHKTPDTIAKKFFHQEGLDSAKLKNLKIVLVLFFLFEQLNGNPQLESSEDTAKDILDKRYDSLIATVLKPLQQRIELPENINILTWNYDFQFEKTYYNYLITNSNFELVQKSIQSIPNVSTSEVNFLDTTKFSIIHINGLCYFRPLNVIEIPDRTFDFISNTSDLLNYLMVVYKSTFYPNETNKIHFPESLIRFAWERYDNGKINEDDDIIKAATSVAAKTNVLIINGYSFPNFNNETDKYIFSKMNNLRKIIIQSPDAENIKNVIQSNFTYGSQRNSITDSMIDNLEYWDRFYIPNSIDLGRDDSIISVH